MIRDLEVSLDGAGFPIVRWTEDRNLASPEAMTRARVECRIMKEADTGILLFVARGTVRHGSFEQGKPWERLRAVSAQSADALYYTRAQLELRPQLASKGVGANLAFSDSAQVILAEFHDDTVMHVNCADALPIEIDRLHLTLTNAFIGNQPLLVGNLCGVAFQWPADDDRVMTYDPKRSGWSDQQKPGLLTNMLDWAGAVGLAGVMGALLLWDFFHR